MKKKKVLFLLEAFDKGGIEQVTLDIVNNLDPEKYDITVQTFWYGGYCQSRVNSNIRVIPFFFKRYVRGIIRLIELLPPWLLYQLFVHGDYDVEIAASDGGAAKVISGSNNKKAKKICWIHMDVSNQGSGLKEYKSQEGARKIYTKYNRIVCVSKYTAIQFINKFGLKDIVDFAHNPIPVEKIVELSEEETNIKFNSSEFNLLAIGSLMRVKGFERLINAVIKLREIDHISVNLYLGGKGPEENNLRKIIDGHNASYITLLGFLKNPFSLMKKADLFVCSSYSEAFPLVIGEALSLGLPVLGTRCSGVCEWLEDDNSGFIVENNDDALYEGLKLLITDSMMYTELVNRTKIKQMKINFDSTMKLWEEKMIIN